MKTTLKWVTAVAVLVGMAGVSRAAQINYYLLVDSNGPGTWSLSASTDAVNGIAAYVVNLDNALTGVSVAPRSSNSGDTKGGFSHGNVFATPAGGMNQAFSRQHVSAVWPAGYEGQGHNAGDPVDPDTEEFRVYGIGNTPVPDSAFLAPVGFPPVTTMTGSASIDANPYVGGLQVEMYNGTYTVGTRIAFSAAGAPISGSVNVPVVGPAGGVMSQQPISAGSVFMNASPDETAILPTFTYTTIFPGDANGDFFVNQLDLNVVSGHWQAGPGSTLADGDVNGDGFVNQLDLNVISGHWQASSPAVGAVSAVPEPGSFVLLGIGLIGLARYRRRFA